MKIAVLIPFFGRFPTYAETFFWSAGKNPQIDFLIFTDSKPTTNYPKNIHFFELTLLEFNTLSTTKTGMKIEVKKEFCYKLCDLKPAFGKIFEDYIANYDYFGYGDLDLVFGDSQKFLNSEKIAKYDIISMRKEYLSGSLTLIKNNAFNRLLFTLSTDCRSVFEDNNNYLGFDEVGHNLMASLKDWTEILNAKREIESFTYIVADLLSKKKLLVDFSTKICEKIDNNQVLLLRNDQLSELSPSSGAEYLYFHWVNEKKKFHFKFLTANQLCDPLYITETGFFNAAQYKRRALTNLLRRVNGFRKKYILHYPRRIIQKLSVLLR
jgi:hypothetical protein